MTAHTSVNPRTTEPFGEPFADTSVAEVTRLAEQAAAASEDFAARGRAWRAELLRAMADDLEDRGDEIIGIADKETGIGSRLNAELTRTAYQARLFAEVLDEGSYLEAAIDHAGDTPMGPGPDLRRMLVPLGPVAVFGASNFPLAFSVPGGDTVSALAAGCPVIVKAHPSHPATSALTFEILSAAASKAGAPRGVLGLVYGKEAGAALVADPRIRAVGFTGSSRAGQVLRDIIGQRAAPIPFYGEMASLNPVVVTESAAAGRGADIAAGLVDSFTASAGQLCTKPGLVFVPGGSAGDALVAELRAMTSRRTAPVALNEGIAESYRRMSDALVADGAAELTAEGPLAETGFAMSPRLVSVAAVDMSQAHTAECFGPLTVVVRYSDSSELDAAIGRLPGSLTGTIHCESDEEPHVTRLSEALRAKAGRVLYNGFPTGVLVSWAQTHGGPWPATNTLHTSVGTSAIRRFLRPVTWQNAPEFVLPPEVRDGVADVPRRVNGNLTLPQ